MSIYKKLEYALNENKLCGVSFKQHQIYIENAPIVTDNRYEYFEPAELKRFLGSEEEVWKEIRRLRKDYLRSVPPLWKGDRLKWQLEKAVPLEELIDEEIINNKDRYTAKGLYEGFVLLAIWGGFIKYPNPDLWFYRFEKESEDGELILKREWFSIV